MGLAVFLFLGHASSFWLTGVTHGRAAMGQSREQRLAACDFTQVLRQADRLCVAQCAKSSEASRDGFNRRKWQFLDGQRSHQPIMAPRPLQVVRSLFVELQRDTHCFDEILSRKDATAMLEPAEIGGIHMDVGREYLLTHTSRAARSGQFGRELVQLAKDVLQGRHWAGQVFCVAVDPRTWTGCAK